MTFKVGTITDAESAAVDIKDPATGRRIATVTLAGPEHPKRKALMFQRQRRMRNALQRTGKLELPDPADEEADNIDLLVACTLAWTEFEDADGKELACTAENARRLYTQEGHGWLRALLTSALEEKDRFIKSSASA